MRVQTIQKMKRVCKRKVMIDALTVCFEVIDHYHLDCISQLDYGEAYDLYEFQLFRIEGRYYDNVYTITYMDDDTEIEFAENGAYPPNQNGLIHPQLSLKWA